MILRIVYFLPNTIYTINRFVIEYSLFNYRSITGNFTSLSEDYTVEITVFWFNNAYNIEVNSFHLDQPFNFNFCFLQYPITSNIEPIVITRFFLDYASTANLGDITPLRQSQFTARFSSVEYQ